MKIIKNRTLYWALIGTFTLLYLAIAFVSTLHAITFFQLANTLGLAILLGAAYEIGQASVLFSILMTDNKNKVLAWAMMFLLTALQVTANVYASFKFMDSSGTNDWTYWQRSILFAVQAESAEMYKVIISWISGALLPLVALGMTSLVAENIRMAEGKDGNAEVNEESEEQEPPTNMDPERIEDIIRNEVEKRLKEREPQLPEPSDDELKDYLKEKYDELSHANTVPANGINVSSGTLVPQIEVPLQPKPLEEYVVEEKIPEINLKLETKEVNAKPSKFKLKKDGKLVPTPINKVKSWHLLKEFVDDEHNVFNKGKFVGNDPTKTPTSKKA